MRRLAILRLVEFPEIELTYDTNTARAEAARCYRCDAETGSADYSVQHREDIFSMARTDPHDAPKLIAPPRGCGRPKRHESALTDSRRSSTEGNTQPFVCLVNILSRWLANDCRSLLLNAGGPPVCIPLARNVSMKSRMLSRWRMVSVE